MPLTAIVDKRTPKKYKKEAKEKTEMWKLSWDLHTNWEERTSKTVEVGCDYFETEKLFTIPDAPAIGVLSQICGWYS